MIYWITTTLLCALLLLSAASYVFHQATIDGVRNLGFPDFFRLQLVVLKLVAALVLTVPTFPHIAKDWAYAGVALFIVTAIVAHTAHKDPFSITMVNIIVFLLLVISRLYLPD